jgi:uncharacterized protein (TIGR02453 family)
MPRSTNPIRSSLFEFLKELADHNDREWFAANKERYEECVREPLLQFIRDFEPRLFRVSPHFVADDRRQGGSLIRPYRDTRFSADKRPYKTNAGIQFPHRRNREIHAPGFYVHLEPGGCFVGVGIWMPPKETLLAIRQAIDEQGGRWVAVMSDPVFTGIWSIDRSESLKKAPMGFDPDHPQIEDLRLKSHTALRKVTEREACAGDFGERLESDFRVASGYLRFLCEAVELPF